MRISTGLVLIVMSLTLFTPSGVRSQDRGFGLGLILGDPTGLSAKGWLSPTNAIDIGMAWSFRYRGFLHIHGDYLWHFNRAIQSQERFVPYVGIGGRLGVGDAKSRLGIRIAGGIAWWSRDVPLDVFLEVAPILDLAPATELSANGGIGARFYFR
jgi:hypothetical protein